MKNLFIIIYLVVSITIAVPNVFAAEISAGSSGALLKSVSEKAPDSRTKILKEFLGQYNSPLVPFAQDFVEIADKYDLDWKMVAAISGVESTFGKFIPYNSYNGWGWGIYGSNVIRFSSWREGIETVSKGLRINYIDKGATNIYQIGRVYAESPTWASRVKYFMQKMSEFEMQNLASNLPISL